jgi:hypothetical protein
MMAEKRYDSYTRLDDDNRMVAHYCPTGDCFHCTDGVPFDVPPADGLAMLTTETLRAIRAKNLDRLADLRMKDDALTREIESRG